MQRLMEIPLDQIRANPIALRDVNRKSEEFQELMNSIRSMGIISAISVREKPGEDGKKFELIDGLQRFTSAQEAGTGIVEKNPQTGLMEGKMIDNGTNGKIGVVPAIVLERDDAEALLTQIVGNVQRVEMKPAQYAAGLRRLLGYHATWTMAELAAKLNKSPAWVDKQLSLNKLHDSIKPLVDEGKISVTNAIVLAKLPQEEQLQWMDRAQTDSAEKFGTEALERVKQIREANRRGEDAEDPKFTPVVHIRKKAELENEMRNPQVTPQLVIELNVTDGLKTNKDGLIAAAQRGAQLGVQWACSFDTKSQKAQEEAYIEREKHNKEQSIRRDAEKKQKRAVEAAERTAKAQKDAEEAKKKADALPPEQKKEPVAAGV